ncbi:LuxR C-terminal-related transcriptional regulator [Kitasatospora sp. NPDC057940]|uniref:LuxR C-terminal-related transcriptional regulator n=1 Tax=Kitasatospora sp. NPDC057940 TaxID=3346285 RepID=UPI0036DC14CB
MHGRGAERPDQAAHDLYLRILRRGGWIDRAEAADADRPALDHLLALGLLLAGPESDVCTAVDPRTVGDRISAELRAEGTRLLVQAAQLPQALDDLTKAYDTAPRPTDRAGTVHHVQGLGAVIRRFTEVEADCRQEILVAQPGRPRHAHQLEEALERIGRFCGRGGRIRVIYAPGAVRDQATADHTARGTELGARFRVLAEPFRHLHIFDRRIAVLQSADDLRSATFIEDPATVDHFLAVFERDWARSGRLLWSADESSAPESTAHEQVGRLLAQGLTQRAIAGRLGLSERTVAGHIARLRELHDAETLFQLGWQLRGARTGEPDG